MILVRHGESEFNVVYGKTRQDPGIEDPRLTERGRSQARAVAEHFSSVPITRIIASPYTRALETAEPIAERLGLEIEVTPLIGERAAFTCDVGSPRSALEKRWPHLRFSEMSEIWWSWPESEADIARRGNSFVGSFPARSVPGLLVVSHWGFIREVAGLEIKNCMAVSVASDGAAEIVYTPQP